VHSFVTGLYNGAVNSSHYVAWYDLLTSEKRTGEDLEGTDSGII
jgi:hypothetical protein